MNVDDLGNYKHAKRCHNVGQFFKNLEYICLIITILFLHVILYDFTIPTSTTQSHDINGDVFQIYRD